MPMYDMNVYTHVSSAPLHVEILHCGHDCLLGAFIRFLCILVTLIVVHIHTYIHTYAYVYSVLIRQLL